MAAIFIIASTLCYWAVLILMRDIVRTVGFPEGGWPGLIIMIVLAATGTVFSIQSILEMAL